VSAAGAARLLEPTGAEAGTFYFPVYRLHEQLSAADAAWLSSEADDGAVPLTYIVEVCTTYGVRAELRDPHGFVRGRVAADGDYLLLCPP
jgi:hypothetical protein